MEACLLCLDVKNNVDNIIRVNSKQWETENVKYLIEKHLWSVDTLKTSSWMCHSCWQELDDFHQFYTRIEKVHSELGKLKDMEDVKALIEKSDEPFLNLNMCKEELMENSVQTEILMDQPLSTEYVNESENPLIKVEQDDEELTLEDMPLKQRRRRGRPPKNMVCKLTQSNKDPLMKIERNKLITKNQKRKDFSKNLINDQLESNDKALVKNEIEPINISKEANISSDGNDDSDTEYDEHDDKQQMEICRKKRKNPDEKTRKEHDKLIAEYFKIYCSLCQIPIENFIALRKHFREEHDKRGFVICCKKKIFTRPILVDHIHFHLDPNYFKCKQCDKIYSDRCTLESHMKIHEDGQQDRNHTCDICGKSFVGITQLENHKQTHAPDYEKKFSCNECGKFFTTLYSLNYHIQAIHHNKYVKICDICGKTMRCRNSFKLHMEKHDNKLATPINCDICGLRLIDRRGLRRHKNSQHPVGGKKEYSCHICSKISPNLRALRTHVRFAHETGYIHKCTMCDKAFKRPEALKEHMATHTGTPLYTCPWCPKTFISNGNMHNHRKKSHPKEWEEAQRQKYGGIFPSNHKPPAISVKTNTTIN
ncbi:LOW QUALITY PROTEIN: transcription factor grauzone-like [Lucilia sericata]|uniref:LOW QUALITY PROTEIN: transcription factor grauzone-like n=1 Tax=Lucilia sericata TaxID=13632 RepID=UPI0018A82D78|nr:LOW QUALITY PROTEIN: transcription factor grauzone-like [Lucilia sericata]